MPYVEGFGTYPFGEEWLFEAWARSHVPVMEAADRVTVTVTPVLADQLEACGVGERMERFLREHRIGTAEADAAGATGEGERIAAEAEAAHYREALAALGSAGPLEPFVRAGREGRVELTPSAATHAVLPKLATDAGRRLQVDAGLRSHRRRFGPSRGFWLPECAWEPGVDDRLAEAGIEWTVLDQSAVESGEDEPLRPARLPSGAVAFTIDWGTVELAWSEGGYPSDPSYLEYHRLSPNGTRLWSIGDAPYDPESARATAERHAADFLEKVAARLAGYRGRTGAAGLCVFAIDTELLGHWWAEGPLWLGAVIRDAAEAGVNLVTLSQALERHEATERPLARSSWGEGKSMETWDSPAVDDLVRAARRLELRLIRSLTDRGAGSPADEAALRATRELLAAQASDWAFMDHRGQAGDYPYRRAITHAAAMLEALESPGGGAAMRNLAPDLSLAPVRMP